MSKILIIYHKEDNDGVISAAIIDYCIHDDPEDIIEYLGVDYNDLKTIDEKTIDTWYSIYNFIILTDISLNENLMSYLYTKFGTNVAWFDHHKPIIESSFKYGFSEMKGLRDINHSAILNAYIYNVQLNNILPLNKDKIKIPEMFKILSAYDSWTFKQEGYDGDYVKKINLAVTVDLDLDIEKAKKFVHKIIKELYDNNEQPTIDNYLTTGNIIFKYNEFNNKTIIKSFADDSFTIDNKPIITLFMQGGTNSTMFEYVKNINPEIQHGAVFKHKKDGWILSLYNIYDNCDFDCGQYLKEKYNGGGHKGAAGCTLSEQQFIEIYNAKTI
ncbi:hypothetical protein J6O48_00460 [bacterium]|nr:hypothetical protein [bacterium]